MWKVSVVIIVLLCDFCAEDTTLYTIMSTVYDDDGEDSGPVDVEGIETGEPQRTVSNSTASQRIELQPADFLFGKTFGEGAFARVVHARSKRAGTDFAVKIMEKRHIKKENKVHLPMRYYKLAIN